MLGEDFLAQQWWAAEWHERPAMALAPGLSMGAADADPLLLQPHMQAAPVIQKEKLSASITRTNLMGKGRVTRPVYREKWIGESFWKEEAKTKKRKLGIAEGCFADHPSLRANQTKPSLRPWLVGILILPQFQSVR
jgi:hypothetical protein